jgi:thiamine-phosphate pyrophosphorylase
MSIFDPRLYLVTTRYNFGIDELLRRTEAAIRGGVTMVQLREKEIEGGEFYHFALKMRDLTRKMGVTFWINDRVDIALAVEADGIHVGQSDLPAKAVRKIIPQNMLLGISAKTVDDARRAEQEGADCLGSGAVFPTNTKDSPQMGTQRLAEIKAAVKIPVVAIGGINAANAKHPLACGVDGIAVVSAIMQAEDTCLAARELRAVVDSFLFSGKQQF